MTGFLVAVLLAGAVALWTGVQVRLPVAAWPSRRPRDAAPARWARIVEALSDELRSGATVTGALAEVASEVPEGAALAAPGFSFADAAVRDGLPEVAHLGLALDVAHSSGASLDEALGHIADSLRARGEDRALVDQELASTKATVVVLALLPLIGAGLAAALGGASLQWLTGTAIGRMCLVGGLVLQGVGVWWIRRMVRAVTV